MRVEKHVRCVVCFVCCEVETKLETGILVLSALLLRTICVAVFCCGCSFVCAVALTLLFHVILCIRSDCIMQLFWRGLLAVGHVGHATPIEVWQCCLNHPDIAGPLEKQLKKQQA